MKNFTLVCLAAVALVGCQIQAVDQKKVEESRELKTLRYGLRLAVPMAMLGAKNDSSTPEQVLTAGGLNLALFAAEDMLTNLLDLPEDYFDRPVVSFVETAIVLPAATYAYSVVLASMKATAAK